MSDATPGTAELLVASNRGPLSFTESDDGSLVATRGGGGLVSGLSSMANGERDHDDVVWVCAALTEGDRAAARHSPRGRLDQDGHDTGGLAVRMLDIDPATFHRAYNAIANSTLWFVHHLLYATPTAPVFDAGFRREWSDYESYNRAFAEALADEASYGAKVLVQDYHLTLLPRQLRELRPDLRIAHFSHTPWAPVGLLPAAAGRRRPRDPARDARRRPRGLPLAAVGARLRAVLRRPARRQGRGRPVGVLRRAHDRSGRPPARRRR